MRRFAIKPHQAVLVVGVLVALGTIASGILPRLTGWEEASPISRHVFGGVPDPIYWLFYTTVPVVLLVCAWLISLRVQNYERGRPDDRRTKKSNVEHRMRDFRSGVWMQTLLRDPAAGVMHSFIYFGFLVLFAATIILEIDHQLPDDLKFLHGRVYQAYSATADIFGVVFVVGIVWAIVRRYVQRPYRIRIKTKPEDAVILGTFLVIGLTGFLTEGIRLAEEGTPSFERWSLVGYPIGQLFESFDWSNGTLADLHTHHVDRALRRVRGVHRHPADHEAAPHDHVADEHVPLRHGPAEGRDEAPAEPDGDGARHVRCLDRSRTSPGSSSSTPMRARSAAAARRCARRTRPASRSTRARSC